jgi:hypothetical protein
LIEELSPRTVKLPHDVLFLIFTAAANIPPPFDHLSNLKGDHWGLLREAYSEELLEASGILARLSQVSKAWHGTAVPLLYQRMRIKTEVAIAKAAATLEYRHNNPCLWIGSPHGAFVRILDVGNRRESYPQTQSTRVIADLHNLVVYTPNLRSYHSSTWISSGSALVSNFYSSRIVPNLLKTGRSLTTLEMSDQKFALADINILVHGLPSLEKFIVSGLLLWELQLSRKRITSTSLKTLVIVEPDGADGNSICLYGHIFNAISTWNIPNLHTVLIHDCCGVIQVLGNMALFLSAHQSKVRQIVFRRWVTTFSENEVSLLTSTFSEFSNIHSTQNSVRFWRN